MRPRVPASQALPYRPQAQLMESSLPQTLLSAGETPLESKHLCQVGIIRQVDDRVQKPGSPREGDQGGPFGDVPWRQAEGSALGPGDPRVGPWGRVEGGSGAQAAMLQGGQGGQCGPRTLIFINTR